MNKYRNIITEVDGIKFHSKKEANRYCELKILRDAHLIIDLELQPVFKIVVNKIKICKYIADFRYYDKALERVIIEDVKSPHTAKLPVYRLKKKLVLAVHGVTITEV